MLVFEHIFGDESPECLQEYIFFMKGTSLVKNNKVTSEVILNVSKECQPRSWPV